MIHRGDEGLGFLLRYENVAWYESGEVRILDRRIYPRQIRFVSCRSHREVASAIRDMVTQSAGPYTAAGMGMALAAYECRDKKREEQRLYLREAAERIATARPTTENRMRLITGGCLEAAEKAMRSGVKADRAIFEATLESLERRYRRMSEVAKYLVDLFPREGSLMTQCFGETIVGTMLREARERNLSLRLFCPETRPYLQGARLTASLAADMGFEVFVVTDNMAAAMMQKEKIDLFTSAADRICLDGHIVNKIGTFQLAILAKYFALPYFVTGIPDADRLFVDQVRMEERDPSEVLMAGGKRHTAEGVQARYPSFDITPPHLISGIVTDKGIYAPYDLGRYFETETERFY